MSKPRQYTTDEVREKLLSYVRGLVDYWDKTDRPRKESLSGLAFSILSTLDGGSVEVPGFVVAPSPHESDEEYHRQRGENWYPRVESEHDIAGCLHELFYKK